MIRRWRGKMRGRKVRRARQCREAALRSDPIARFYALDRFGLCVTNVVEAPLHTEGWNLRGFGTVRVEQDTLIAALVTERPDGACKKINSLGGRPLNLSKGDSLEIHVDFDLNDRGAT